jgi:hypothetical protein
VAGLLPDGKGALFTIFGGAGVSNSKVAFLDLETKRHEVLFEGAAGRYVSSGHVVFFRAGVYYAVSFDASRRLVTGPERRVLPEARPLDPLALGAFSYVSFSDTGRLAFMPGMAVSRTRLAWIDRDGHTEELPFEGQHYGIFRLAPDGRRVAGGLVDGSDIDLWIYDLARGTQEKLMDEGLS